MTDSKIRSLLGNRQFQAICGVAIVFVVLMLMVLTYPHVQLKMANHLINSGNYAQAEQILTRLISSKPEWTEPRYQLTISQLYQGKGREAAATVFSLAEASYLEEAELAVIFLNVAEYLYNTGHGDAALELGQRVLTQRSDDELLVQAVIESGFKIADLYDLPLALEAITTSLSYAGDNWQLNRKAFNLLLAKALESPPHLAEPALDQALKLYPTNIIAITRKASLLADRAGAKEALDFLAKREPELLDISNQDYLNTKKSLIFRLANTEPGADLTLYTKGMSETMVMDTALQGLNQAFRNGKSGYQYYLLASFSPQVGYQYGRNLSQIGQWEEAETVFRQVKKLDPEYANFLAIFTAIDAHLKTQTSIFASPGFTPDMVEISPDGKWLAWRRWINQPWTDEFEVSDLVLTKLADGTETYLGDTILFKWSPDSDYLAFLTMTRTGLGRLHIYTISDGTRFTFPGDYDILDFNWAGNNLMVQAEKNDQIYLLHLSPSWKVTQELLWDTISDVNHDYAWISFGFKKLLVHKQSRLIREFSFEHDLLSYSHWSPNGNLAIIEDSAGKSWIYNHQQGSLTAIESAGTFAAWGEGERILWYLPVWERLYILVRLDDSGSIREYLPYSFAVPLYDVSITANGSALVLVDRNEIVVSRK